MGNDMTLSATIPVEHVDAANTELDELGFGPESFSVPARSGSDAATHAGLHCWNNAAFLTALQGLSYAGLTIRADDDPDTVNFATHCADQTLEWSDPTLWFQNPVMTGDQRTFDSKTWESLVDYNVWQPPVGWREVVADGYPDWVQPTGAHDAYALGDRVAFEGSDYESLINANVWSPTAYPAGWLALA